MCIRDRPRRALVHGEAEHSVRLPGVRHIAVRQGPSESNESQAGRQPELLVQGPQLVQGGVPHLLRRSPQSR
eukprot:2419836-Alexandrium_andersonii.AAC.1